MVSLFSGGYWKPRQVTLRDEAEIHLQLLYKCIFNPGFRRQTIQRLMVKLNVFPQELSDKSENNRSVATQIMAGSYPKCTVGDPNQIFFPSIPLALFSNNNSSKKYLAAYFSSKGVADFISFFEAIISLGNRPLSFSRRFKWHDVISPHLKNSSDLNFVLLTI